MCEASINHCSFVYVPDIYCLLVFAFNDICFVHTFYMQNIFRTQIAFNKTETFHFGNGSSDSGIYIICNVMSPYVECVSSLLNVYHCQNQ